MKYIDKLPDRIYAGFDDETHLESYCLEKKGICQTEFIRKDLVVEAVKLAWGAVSMNPFDCSETFVELLKMIGYGIH